ncbi:MAG: O-antigen ligase family protein [Candidatus Krumholzibacteriota bacterium]|nr:O-antigen ligase family protein [Candidatus Krumholzibacteriota bacterium]
MIRVGRWGGGDIRRGVGIFFLGAFVFSSTFSIAATQTALTLGIILWIIGMAGDKKSRPRRTTLDIPILLFFAATILAVWGSVDRAGSLRSLKNYLLFSVIIYSGSLISSRRLGHGLYLVLLTSGSASALYGILVSFLGYGRGSLGRTPGPFSVAMTYGGIMMLLCSLFLSLGIGKGISPKIRAGSLAGTVLTAFALFLSLTRSSWVGMFISGLAIMLILRRKLVVPFVGILVVMVFILPPAYQERISSIWDPQFRTNVQRIEMLRGGLSIWREYPLIGTGPVDLATLYDKHKPPGAVHVHGHMHNIFLHVAVTLGLVGLLAFCYLLFSFLRVLVSVLKLDLPPPERAWAAGSIGALAGFTVNGLFEWNFGDAEVITLLFIIIGSNLALREWVGGKS